MERLICFHVSDSAAGLANECLIASLHALLANTTYATRIRLYLPGATGQSQSDDAAILAELTNRLGVNLAADRRIELHPPVDTGLPGLLSTLPTDSAEVLIIESGILVPPGWDTRLRTIAATDPRIGSLSPLCAGLPPLAEDAPLTTDEWLRRDRLIAELGADQHPQLPLLLPACCYLSGRAVAALSDDEEPDDTSLAVRLERAGLINLIALNLLVAWDPQSDSRKRLSDYLAAAKPYSELFGWLRETWRKPPSPPPSHRPAQLHIAHSWGGGLGHWVDDFIRGDEHRSNLVLKSIGSWGAFGQRLELYAGYSDLVPLRVWTLTTPIGATALARLEYHALLREIIDEYGVQAIVVSSLIGHALDALSTGLPTLLIAHDHYPFCITLYAHFQGVCEDCDGERLRRCLAENPAHRFFRQFSAEDWEALRRAFVRTLLTNPVTLVAPAESVLARWRRQMPALTGLPARVIPHGLGLSPSPPLAGNDTGRLRLVIPGTVSWAKGLPLLEQALPALGKIADVRLIGCGTEGRALARLPGVSVIESYNRGELGAELAAWRPHLGLLCSLVPETFSYTLSELQHYGIPVLATRVGSFVDRIEDGVNGFLYPPDAQVLIRLVERLDRDRELIDRVRDRLRQQPTRDLTAMVQDYRALLPVPPSGAPLRGIGRLPQTQTIELIHVQPQATYAMALRAFARYTFGKVYSSPRMPIRLRHLLSGSYRLGRALIRHMRPKH